MAHAPLLRVSALHALAYCERLFYLEEVEEIRIPDAAVYSGRALHAALDHEEGASEKRTIESERLGLTWKVI
jgi:CRISPR-associated protein Cas1